MTTPRELMIAAMEVTPGRPVERGDLSLALAGAELIDLLTEGAVTLDGDRIVPGHRTALADPLLDQAADSLTREAPQEPVGDWLWRRGRGLASAYVAALDAEGRLTRRRHRWLPFRTGPVEPVDSPDRRSAADHWASGEPVLASLAMALGIRESLPEDAPDVGDAVETVLAAINDALLELEAVRQRRSIEQAAFDNIWRGG